MLKAIDLFAGCGGFSCGMSKAGIQVVSAVEFDKSIAESYIHNHKNVIMLAQDIKSVDNENYFTPGQADIIIGGPPCQGFSTAGARIRRNFIDDERNYLFKHYLNIVMLVKPKLFVFENVKGIVNYKGGRIFNEIKKAFAKEGYRLQYFVAKAKDFGIPQGRERTILIGALFNFDLQSEIEKTKSYILLQEPHFFDNVSVWDAIGNLPTPTKDGFISNPKPSTDYQKYLSCSKKEISNHIATNHKSIALRRMQRIKQNENFIVLSEKINSVHSGSYGRLAPDSISATITTRFDTPSGGKFIHPYENRTITPREAARIQSFPDDFEFVGNKTSICKQIGNAVPPKLAYFLGIMIRRLFDDC